MSSTLPPDFEGGILTTVNQGDCRLSGEGMQIFSTLLGSCVSACVRDRAAGVGGMNHFLLAAAPGGGVSASARYGAFAMEQLINGVLQRGTGLKGNLEIKIFGGGRITPGLEDVGSNNVAFVRQFLRDERYSVAGEDVGGNFARRVLFDPRSGKVFVKRLDSTANASIAMTEQALARKQAAPKPVDIELF
jgi:chemotaxis protein CheD